MTPYNPLDTEVENLQKKRFKGFVMQPKSLPLILWTKAGISANALMLYQIIVNSTYFSDGNEKYLQCPFKQSQLPKLTGKSRNSIRKWLLELENYGLIKRSKKGVIVAQNYGMLYNDRRSKDRFSQRENFEKAWSELFPPLAEKLQQRTKSVQPDDKKD